MEGRMEPKDFRFSSLKGKRDKYLVYENYEQFANLMEEADFGERLRHPKNSWIIHRLVKGTKDCPLMDIAGRKDILTKLVKKRECLLNARFNTEIPNPLFQKDIHLDLIKALIEERVNVYDKTRADNQNFLHCAVGHLHPHRFEDLVIYLEKKRLGRLMREKDYSGQSALEIAHRKRQTTSKAFLAMGFKNWSEAKAELGPETKQGNTKLKVNANPRLGTAGVMEHYWFGAIKSQRKRNRSPSPGHRRPSILRPRVGQK